MNNYVINYVIEHSSILQFGKYIMKNNKKFIIYSEEISDQ